NNCHKDFGGIRDSVANDYKTPFLEGNYYPPFELESDSGQKVCFVKAVTDKVNYKSHLGQVGIFFRPSIIAGDSYRLTAEIDFTGLANAAELEKLHKVTSAAKR